MRHIMFLFRVALSACVAMFGCAYAEHQNDQNNKRIDEAPVVLDQDATRSISVKTPNQVTFGPAAFGGTDRFFVGAKTAVTADAAYSLSRASLNRATDNTWSVSANPLAPATNVTVNNGTKKQASPLSNKTFNQVGLLDGTYPIVVTPASKMEFNEDDNNLLKFEVALLDDATTGNKIYSNATLRDGNNQVLQNSEECVALAASQDTIFVAFQPKSGTLSLTPFGSAFSGVSRLQKDPADNFLRAIKLDGSGRGLALAYEIFVQGGSNTPAAFLAKPYTKYSPLSQGVYFASYNGTNDPQPKLGPVADMHWDPVLERLYIGLTGATAGQAQPAAIQSLLVGRIDTTSNPSTNTLGILRVEPALEPSAAFGYPDRGDGLLGVGDDNETDSLIGFSREDASARQTDAYKVRTMHTSTGKAYVIVNGGVIDAAGNKDKTLVHALPLATQDPNPDYNGFIADHLFQNASGDTTTNAKRVDPATGTYGDRTSANVGAGYDKFRFISGDPTQALTDMQVLGDTVYASVAGTRNSTRTQEAGLFSSSAIFNQKGAVRAWTPWQRVGGTQAFGTQTSPDFNSVTQFGVDENSQNVWYLDGTDNKTLRVSQWGLGDVANHEGSPLALGLAVTGGERGDVTNLIAFDGATPGFKQAATGHLHDYFSMMVATGYGRVALIQTGRSISDIFVPIRKFTSAEVVGGVTVGSDPNVYIFSTGKNSLPDLGRVIAAEVARQEAGNNAAGWLFVGGEKGLAVLRNVNDGTGWLNTTNNGLSELMGTSDGDYPGGKNFAWQQLTGPNGETFADVRKIVADGMRGFVYVLTRTQLIRLTPNADDMKSGTLRPGAFASVLDLNAGTLAGTSFDGGYIPVGTSSSSTTAANYATSNRALSLRVGVDGLFDMILIETILGTGPASKIVLATTSGVIVSNTFLNPTPTSSTDATGLDGAGSATKLNNIFFQLPAQFGGGDLEMGPAIRFDVINALRGGRFDQPDINAQEFVLEGNVYVTAYDKDLTSLNVYRFNINNGDVFAFNEPYQDVNGAQTQYFYKIGDITSSGSQYLRPEGPVDFIGTKDDFGSVSDGFLAAIPMVPNSAAYQKLAPPLSAEAVNLGRVFDGDVTLSAMTIDPGSGAKYIFGEFGVLVNE